MPLPAHANLLHPPLNQHLTELPQLDMGGLATEIMRAIGTLHGTLCHNGAWRWRKLVADVGAAIIQ